MYESTEVTCSICTKPYIIHSLFGVMPEELLCPTCKEFKDKESEEATPTNELKKENNDV